MKFSIAILNTSAVLTLIEEAKNAELCRDIDYLQSVLSPIWPDIQQDPDFSDFPDVLRAELLRVIGFFVAFYGKSRSDLSFTARSKDYLTTAIGIFERNGLPEKAVEAKAMMAISYWYAGEVEECESILSYIEEEFEGSDLHPVRLQIQLTRVMVMWWRNNPTEAVDIIKSIRIGMEFCTDVRLKAFYHNQAGIIFNVLNDFRQAVFHLKEAIRCSTKSNNERFAAFNMNNLAYSYKELGQFDQAHSILDQALCDIRRLGDSGWVPHFLDTKALIYVDEHRFEEALQVSSNAVDEFTVGGDMRGLTDAIWTKCRCLLSLGRKEDGLSLFAELINLASTSIGVTAVNKFTKALADEIYVIRRGDLPSQTVAFKKELVKDALRASGGAVVEAAVKLGLKSHQALSDMLNKQFPELYDELAIPRRKRRADSVKAPVVRETRRPDRDIASIKLPPSTVFQSNGQDITHHLRTYYCSARLMGYFGGNSDVLLAVAQVTNVSAGAIILYELAELYSFAVVEFEPMSELCFIEHNGFPTPLDELQIIGEPIGFCALTELDSDRIAFTPMPERSQS